MAFSDCKGIEITLKMQTILLIFRTKQLCLAWRKSFCLRLNFMFTDGEHKFIGRKHIFKAVEHKFVAHKHKIE